jgi:radical SAM superfamily enzyme YgiQ (UPF0313 family)
MQEITEVEYKNTKILKVGLVQLNSAFAEQHYLPLSAGMLESYAKKYISSQVKLEFTVPVTNFGDPEEIALSLEKCDVVGFSIYVWNEQISLAIAKAYKILNPQGIIVFGGPQVPNSQKQFRRLKTKVMTTFELTRERAGFSEEYHRTNRFIDFCIHGEGERAFCALLEAVAIKKTNCLDDVPSISYIDDRNRFKFNPIMARMNDEELASTGSPLLDGVFDRILNKNKEQKWILMYETDRGCPYQCSYCDWGGAIEDKVQKFPMERIKEEIMWIGRNKIPYVFLCNANFGILQRDKQIAEYFSLAKELYGYPQVVSTQNAKNPKTHTLEALSILEKAGLNKAAVMSQQSLNEETLKAVRRDNMKLAEYDEIQRKLADEGVFTMTDLIFPMPNETYETLVDAVETLVIRGQSNKIQFNNLSILKNTEMGDPEYQRQYGMHIKRIKIINVHGSKLLDPKIPNEYQDLVLGTETMPPPDWKKARIYCWYANLLFFNKLLYYPLMLGIHLGYFSLQAVIESFMSIEDEPEFPIISQLTKSFSLAAEELLQGTGNEFIHSYDFLDVYWPPEELAFIKLVNQGEIAAFYVEAKKILLRAVSFKHPPVEIIESSTDLNEFSLKLPGAILNHKIKLPIDVLALINSIKRNETSHVEFEDTEVRIDDKNKIFNTFEQWAREVVWYESRRGNYLRTVKNASRVSLAENFFKAE